MTQLYSDPFGAPWRVPWLRMLLQWKGGILQMFLWEWLFAVSICSLVLTAVYFSWKDNNDELSAGVEALTQAVTFVARRFQAAMALMLGFYSVQNMNRWKEVRNVEGNAMGNINNLALQIAWRIRDRPTDSTDSTGPDVTNVRLQLIRWLNLSHALVVGQVYNNGRRNEFASLDNFVKYGLATEDEVAFLQEQESLYKYVAPFLWCMDLVEELEKHELFGVDGGTVSAVAGAIVDIRRNLADLHALKHTPIPLSYRQLTNLTVRLYMLILLLAAALFEKSDDDGTIGRLSTGSFWIILVYAFEYLLYVGWLTVADAIGNPYRDWSDGLDWDIYVKELNRNSFLIASRFKGEIMVQPSIVSDPYGVSDEENRNGEADPMEATIRRNWDRMTQSFTDKEPKGFKAKRKILTGW